MFTTLILIIILFGGAYYFVRQRYDSILHKIEQVNASRKQVNQALNERHKAINQILQYAKAQELKPEPIKTLASLRRKVKEAHEQEDDEQKIQAEVGITENAEGLLTALAEINELKQVADDYKAASEQLMIQISQYHKCIEAYDDSIEQFAESILIAVFEKDLFRKFPIFEHVEEEETELTDDFI